MPTISLTKNELDRQQDVSKRVLFKLKESARVCKERKCMTQRPEFCRYSENPDNCRLPLVEAWRKKTIDKYCIIEGLKTDFDQCQEVLQNGIYKDKAKGPAVKLSSSQAERSELEKACKEIFLFGYPLEIKAIYEVFYKAFYRLIRTVIYRFGFSDNTNPSSDDIFQQVFLNLHRQFLKGASIKGPLKAYVAKVTTYECFRLLRSKRRKANLADEDNIQETTYFATAIIPFEAVDLWEHFDNRLSASEHGNLINMVLPNNE